MSCMRRFKRLLPLILCLLLAVSFCPARAEGDISFTFFQIEDMRADSIGDSTLIRFPNGETMLIDALMPECAPRLIEQIEALGVNKIDYLVITHMHIDHIGGMAAIIRHFEIGRLFSPGVPYSTDTYRAFAAARDAKGLKEERLSRGDALAIGGATLQVLNPLIDDALYKQFVDDALTVAQTNQHSVAFMLTYGDFKALFTGDLYQERERDLYQLYGDQLACTLLKISHHGADTSGHKLFVKKANAKIAVAMGNTAIEPWLYERYRRDGECAVYMTMLDGTVTVRADDRANTEVTTQWTRSAPNYPL